MQFLDVTRRTQTAQIFTYPLVKIPLKCLYTHRDRGHDQNLISCFQSHIPPLQ